MKCIFGILLGFSFSASAFAAVDLDQAVESTLQKNESVAQTRAQVRQSEELIKQARGAIYPTLNLNASYLVQPKPADPIAAEFFPEKQTTTNLTLTQPLFRGFREFAALRRQNDLFEAQKQTSLTQMIDIYQKVAESYLEVLALEQDLRNVEAQKTIYQSRIKDLQGRARRGESSSSETLTAQSTAAALDAEFQMQSSKLRSARQNFSFLTGLALDTPLSDIGDVSANLPTVETYLSRIEERPDVKILKAQSEASGEDVSIARGAHWPTLDFTGNYYLTRPDGFMKDLKWDAQLRLTFPLFEGGIRQSQIRAAASKQGETELGLQQVRRKAETEIKSLHESLRLRSDQIKALKLSSDLSEKNYRVLLQDSKRGLVRSIDVQLGLTEFRLAKRNYDQARYQAHLERIRLELASAAIPNVLKKEIE